MTTEGRKLIDRICREIKGQVKVGDVVGHDSHELPFNLIDIQGDMGICKLLDDETIYKFPIRELVNVNEVRRLVLTEAILHKRRN